VPLLGVNGVCIIAHGRSHGRALKSAIRIASEAAAGGLVEHIAAGMAERRARRATREQIGV
jgi:phosphate acyltransferase